MSVNLLDRAIYSYADVDRLVGLHAGTARRWLEGYRRGQHFYEPVRTEVLAEGFRAGTSVEELADLYDLGTEQVHDAIRFELIAGSDRAA